MQSGYRKIIDLDYLENSFVAHLPIVSPLRFCASFMHHVEHAQKAKFPCLHNNQRRW